MQGKDKKELPNDFKADEVIPEKVARVAPSRASYLKAFFEVLGMSVLRALIMTLNLVQVKNKIAEAGFLATAIALQVLVSCSILYTSYKRSCICKRSKESYDKLVWLNATDGERSLLEGKQANLDLPKKRKSRLVQPFFIVEVITQIVSAIGVTATPFFYKMGKLETWVYAILMVFFFVLGSFSYFPSVVDRRESNSFLTALNAELDILVEDRHKRLHPRSRVVQAQVVYNNEQAQKSA